MLTLMVNKQDSRFDFAFYPLEKSEIHKIISLEI